MVKKYPNGRGSGKMHSLVPGDSISFRMLSEFPYRPNQFSAIGLVAGGSGITPIYQLIQTVLRNPADTTRLSLVYANNTEADILLRAEMDALAREFPKRFRVSYAVSKGEGAGLIKGYVTKEVLARTMPSAMEGDKVKMLVSGPPPMTGALAGKKGFWGWTQGSMGGALKELGWEKAQVYKF
jgi:cytochrome-b5 reductase